MKSICALALGVIALFSISGCGGGGGSSDSSPAFTGQTSAAIITSSNAQTISAGAMNGAGMAIGVQPAAASSGTRQASPLAFPETNKLLNTVIALKRAGENYASPAAKAVARVSSVRQPAAVTTVSGTIDGPCGGVIAYTFTVDDRSGVFSGLFEFISYCDGGEIINGDCEIDGFYATATDEFATLNMRFTDLSSGDYSLFGTVSIDYHSNPLAIAVAADMLVTRLSTGKQYWVENYLFTMTEVLSGYIVEISGRYHDPDHGHVEVSTPVPLVIDFNAAWPKAGELLCVGHRSAVALTCIDEETYGILADLNGDGFFEYDAGVYFWSDF